MIYEARFRKAARLEYDAAASWYESKRRGLGRDFVDAVDKSMGAIREAPNRYRVILGDVRCVYVGHFPYSIYFRVRSNCIIVLAVFHVRREPFILRERA